MANANGNILLRISIVLTCLCSSFSTSDKMEESKDIKFHGFNHLLKEGRYYKILDTYGNALTSTHPEDKNPSVVIVSPWSKLPQQLWEVHHIDEGIIFTPRRFDFNRVTYFTEKNTEAYVVWHLGRPGMNVNASKFDLSYFYLLRNAKHKCLTAFRLKDELELTDFQTCQSSSRSQYWKFERATEEY